MIMHVFIYITLYLFFSRFCMYLKFNKTYQVYTFYTTGKSVSLLIL